MQEVTEDTRRSRATRRRAIRTSRTSPTSHSRSPPTPTTTRCDAFKPSKSHMSSCLNFEAQAASLYLNFQGMFAASANNFPQGSYYIAAPYPGPSSSGSSGGYSLNPNMPPRTTSPPTSTPTQGFIYGPYSYPYSGQPGGRVVGPVIALGLCLIRPLLPISSSSSLYMTSAFCSATGPN